MWFMNSQFWYTKLPHECCEHGVASLEKGKKKKKKSSPMIFWPRKQEVSTLDSTFAES